MILKTSARSRLVGVYEETRRSWHGLAELVLAGPQYRRSGTIRLRIVDGGFATVKEPQLSVVGDRVGDVPVEGLTFAEVAERVGVDVGAPEGVYGDGSRVRAEERITVPDARALGEAFNRADAALREFAKDQTPVLWPEHFDVGITVGECNYGVSLGDDAIDEPYAYVGPWTPRTGPFWTESFGAARRLNDLDDIVAFFDEGRANLG
jgi:hypothetical protein